MKKRKRRKKNKKGFVQVVAVILISGGGLYGVMDYLDSQGIPAKEAVGKITNTVSEEKGCGFIDCRGGGDVRHLSGCGTGRLHDHPDERRKYDDRCGKQLLGRDCSRWLCLMSVGSKNWTYRILTHPACGSYRGADNVLREITVEKVLMPDVENDTVTYTEVEIVLRKAITRSIILMWVPNMRWGMRRLRCFVLRRTESVKMI